MRLVENPKLDASDHELALGFSHTRLELVYKYEPAISNDIVCEIGFEIVKCRKLSFRFYQRALGIDGLDDSSLPQTRSIFGSSRTHS